MNKNVNLGRYCCEQRKSLQDILSQRRLQRRWRLSIHPFSIPASSWTEQNQFTEYISVNSRCYGVIWIAWKREDPPVKAIISVRRQVLLQFIVGLLYLPTEVFQLAVQRVLRAGRVVAAVHDRSEPSGGSTKNNGECGETERGSHRTPTTTRLYCSVV